MSLKAMPDSIDEVMDDPNAYGIPTFEQFIRDKKKYMGSKEDVLESIDRGDPITKARHKYFVEHYRVESLEQAERIARDMGFNLYENFVLDPQLVTDESGRLVNEVRFRSKQSLEKRSGW